MPGRRNHSRFGRLFAAVLLASYAPLGLLGYGLHSLLRCEHCEGCSATVSQHNHHGCACHHHADHESADHESVAAKSTAGSHASSYSGAHDCAICHLLAQAQSPAVLYAALEHSAPLSSLPALGRSLVLAVASEAPLARGPPAVG